MSQKIVLLLFLLLLINPVFSQLDDLYFPGFQHATSNMSLNGAAVIEKNGVLRLTNNTPRIIGHAFYSSPIKFKNSSNGKSFSFSTAFAFAIVRENPKISTHGFAFTISTSKELPGAFPNQYLGLLNATDSGYLSNHLFAVEFDTFKDYDLHDINDNHVGIDINSMISNKSVPAADFIDNSTKKYLNLASGRPIQAWVDYDSIKNLVEVRLSSSFKRPVFPILSFEVDLSPIVKDYMYVGFSSSTGLLTSRHYILGWSFSMKGEAKSLSLNSLPSLPGHKKNHTGLVEEKNADVTEAWELGIGPHRFSYKELKKATKNFRDRELLGFGGFGKVYKGTLTNSNTEIAVKRICAQSKQGLREFLTEIESIGRLRHRNLVRLLGWCRQQGDLLIVYDFMANGSLDKYLFGEPKTILKWEQRFNIIKGVASGLLYLHEGWEQTVIHRDIKAGNVLLDSELNGRLGDFGLAKLYERNSDPISTKVVGTLGYIAPELTRTGKPTTSSDVFAFGALLLEVVCGRKPIEPKALPEELILVDLVSDRWKSGAILDVVDPKLNGEFDEVEAVTVLKLGLMCSNNVPNARPTMRQVVRCLEGEVALPELVAAPEDAYDVKNVNVIKDSNSSELEDHRYSDPVSSNLEKVSTWSFGGDSGDTDIEAGLDSALPLSSGSECR
ncbi:unnamed protein product [Dovyalis caffra]|uniref:non-specific serine/threonine protein kinase n=1 Tax=Dovyalis caffra TaxID=77055 RepID=A0AAV1QYU0_9ROSI|nr:unnamed protein product [Dovyalis caffra]